MKVLQEAALKLLTVLILIGAAAGGWISWQRYHVESTASTVEMVYDYRNILESAAVERTPVDDLFSLYRKSGITSLAVYDETLEHLMNHGFIQVYRGQELQIKQGTDIAAEKMYIQPVNTQDGYDYFEELKKHMQLLYGDSCKVLSVEGRETLEISGIYDKVMTAPLGIFKNSVQRAATHDFYVVLRPSNISHVSEKFIDTFFDAVDSTDRVSAVIFQGKEIFGYKDHQELVSNELNKRHIPIVLIEAQSQLGFEPQAGLMDLANRSDYQVVRLYAMSKDELIKLGQKEAAARFYISDIERNIRMNLFPSYKFPVDGKTLSETNAMYIANVTSRLEDHGFGVGKASLMESYFPSKVLRSLTIAGALSLIVMTFLILLPGLGKWVYALEVVGLMVTECGYWIFHTNLVLQLLALGAAVCTPVVVMTLFLNYCVKRKNTAFTAVGWGKLLSESVVLLWGGGLLSLAGALFVSGLLSDIRFFLEMEYFRGVKVTFVLPLALISLVYIQKFPFFGKVVTSDKDFVAFLKKFCSIQIKLGLLIGLGLLALVGFVFVGRSGNNGAPVPQFEIALRRFLEDVMYARPREKEFLFGHPALLVAMAALYRKWPQLLHYFLIVAVTIGQGSMVETFAHMRSPFVLSLVRGIDGLAAGTLSMIGALIAVMILVRITKFFGERYGKV